jgi:MGT family glycosyltransferase
MTCRVTTTRRFLFAMWEGGGAVPPELAVAARLVARGHAVDVLGDPSLESDATSAGARFFSWKDAPHRSTRTAESEIVRDWTARTPLGAFARARDTHAFAPAHLFAREVVAHFSSRPADVVVADAMLFGALVGAEATRVPFVALIPMTSFLPARGRPPPGLGLAPARGAFSRARDRALYAFGDAFLWRSCLPFLNRARREVNLDPIAHPLDQVRRAHRVLVQTSAWFDFRAPISEGNVRYVGPELGDPAWVSSRVELPRGDAPLVLISLSTTFMGQAKLLQKIVDAIAPLEVRALVTTGHGLDPRAIDAPSHVFVRASAPHAEVLRRAALVVTHAGHGTVIRALAAAVPLVCIPMGRDQSDNAARAAFIGASLTISSRASVARLRESIRRALADGAFRSNAERASREIAREDLPDAAAEIESLAEVHHA